MIRNRSPSSSSPSLLICSKLVVVLVTVLLVIPVPCNGDDSSLQQKASLAKMATDTVSVLKDSYRSSWDKVKTIIRDMQLQFSPPNLDFKSEDGKKGAKDKVIGAAEKSVGVSKSTVEETAETAAKAVGSTVQMTADKVKGAGDQKSSHEEL
ncbi:hypothetical protein LINGRAHAP2_LOCUS33353 [Linum grandiflorum]